MACAAPQSLRAPPSLLTCCKSTSCASWAATGSLCSLRALSGTQPLHQKTSLNLVHRCNECLGTSGLAPPSGTAQKLLPLPPALAPGLELMMKATSGAVGCALPRLLPPCHIKSWPQQLLSWSGASLATFERLKTRHKCATSVTVAQSQCHWQSKA